MNTDEAARRAVEYNVHDCAGPTLPGNEAVVRHLMQAGEITPNTARAWTAPAMRPWHRDPESGHLVAAYADELAAETFGPLEDYVEPTYGEWDTKYGLRTRPVYFENDNVPVAGQLARGHYISTLNGRFFPFDPRPEEVDIEHIAHSLAMTCRYIGACKRYYSTAEHSVHLARWLQARGYHPQVCLAALLHDAPESLSGFGDTARPSKVKAPIIKETEERIYDLAVAPAFGLGEGLPVVVHEADSRIIADEMQQNMHEVDPKYDDPLGIRLEYWSPDVAEVYFLDMFRKLMALRGPVAEKMGMAA